MNAVILFMMDNKIEIYILKFRYDLLVVDSLLTVLEIIKH